MLVVSDDVYNLLTYTNKESMMGPPRRLFAYDCMSDAAYKGNVISNGTFSKFLSPGVRLGWLEVPPRCIRLMHASGLMQSGGASNNYTAGIVATAIDLNLLQTLYTECVKEFGDRMRMAVSVLRAKLPASCSFVEPQGGYFIWITLPEHVDCEEFTTFSQLQYNVAGTSGHHFSVNRKFRNCLRIAIQFHRVDRVEMALERLCMAIGEYLASKNS